MVLYLVVELLAVSLHLQEVLVVLSSAAFLVTHDNFWIELVAIVVVVQAQSFIHEFEIFLNLIYGLDDFFVVVLDFGDFFVDEHAVNLVRLC